MRPHYGASQKLMVKPTSEVIRYFFESGQLLGALNGKFWPYCKKLSDGAAVLS